MAENGLCECGCGEKTLLAPQTHTRKGWIKGQPMRFIANHHLKTLPKCPKGRPGLKGPDNGNWKGGRIVKPHGYVKIYFPSHPRACTSGYVYEHILIAEKALGKPLPPGAQVHHHNEDGTDNKTSGNLVICESDAYHKLLHKRMRDAAKKVGRCATTSA